jgi:hypothetical protein
MLTALLQEEAMPIPTTLLTAKMIKLSISIMHCSWNSERVEMLYQLVKKLGDISSLTKLSISDDTEKQGIWFNCKQAWQQVHPDSTHHLVLQDDMLPCTNFIPALHQIIQLKPSEIIHLFACNRAIDQALKEGKHWHTMPGGSWGGSIILPREHFEWYKWVDQHCLNFHKHSDDTRLDHYAMCHQKLIWNVAPSLIEHIGYDKSLIGNSRGDWRKSIKYIGDRDPLTIDWSQGMNNPVVGGYTWGTSEFELYQHLKPEYRDHFVDKLGLQPIISFLRNLPH